MSAAATSDCNQDAGENPEASDAEHNDDEEELVEDED
jgi:hypothetical protein